LCFNTVMETRIDIGIDGGGTGCRVVVCAQGQEVRAEGGPANVLSDPEEAVASITATLDRALADAALPQDALQRARIVAGLAGCRLPDIADAFAMRLPFLAHVVEDSVTALEGAFEGSHGTLVNLGTGSFFIRRDDRGITHHGGWGLILGDEGSAAWLGREALSLALKIQDGSERQYSDDPLLAALLTASEPHPVLFAHDAGPDDFARIAPLIMQSASPMAKRLRLQVLMAVQQGLQRIAHPDGSPWALTGGLGHALAAHVSGKMAEGLHAPKGTALDGALAMARALP
jgi:glucosamine kinase